MDPLEKAIPFKRRKNHSAEEYFVQPTNLLYVPFVIPKSMAKKIKKIQRDFLWRGRVLEKKKNPRLMN